MLLRTLCNGHSQELQNTLWRGRNCPPSVFYTVWESVEDREWYAFRNYECFLKKKKKALLILECFFELLIDAELTTIKHFVPRTGQEAVSWNSHKPDAGQGARPSWLHTPPHCILMGHFHCHQECESPIVPLSPWHHWPAHCFLTVPICSITD